MPPESMERDDRDDDLRTVDSPTDSPTTVRSPLAAETCTPTTRRGLVSELAHSPSQLRRDSRVKSKPQLEQCYLSEFGLQHVTVSVSVSSYR